MEGLRPLGHFSILPSDVATSATNWQRWMERFELYMLATEKSTKEENIQVATLLTLLGPECMNVFRTFTWIEPADKNKLSIVTAKFAEYFTPRVNETYERYKFLRRRQQRGEPFDTFLTDILNLVVPCNYVPEEKEKVIRDQIVIGLHSDTVRQKLLYETNLTIAMCRNSEITDKYIESMHTGGTGTMSMNTDAVQHETGTNRGKPVRKYFEHRPTVPQTQQQCQNCGRQHAAKSCPAYNQTCRRCSKRGHFAVMCRSSRAGVEEVSSSVDQHQYTSQQPHADQVGQQGQGETIWLGAVNRVHNEPPWTVDVIMNNTTVNFKIDTGADVSVINEERYSQLEPKPILTINTTTLSSPGGNVDCIGHFQTTLSVNNKSCVSEVFVVRGPSVSYNLLSRTAATRLSLVARLDEIDGEIFGEMGTMLTDPVKIKLDPGAQAYNVTVPRRVPIPLLPKVEAELARMEREGLIRKITEPSDWCAPIVVVPKREGVRICVDLRNLNHSMQRKINDTYH